LGGSSIEGHRSVEAASPCLDRPSSRKYSCADALSEAKPARRIRGRPRRLTADKVRQIVRLREEGLTWAQVGQATGLASETARRALWALKNARKAVAYSAEGPSKRVAERPAWQSRGFAVKRAERAAERERNAALPPKRV
jgi:hypothetical protein